ncbi:hypothetical protein [Hyphomicrobium sp. CS1GBMeth3]|uniref:hypothetical protein n=1 Tax=Hyphomicrobium sp. CS1GBMeth3 TaxID=1892845 RepID=UPI000931452E|nr:hypothetical protein [Hyphomicrobium sp. CS1GBMeth3]
MSGDCRLVIIRWQDSRQPCGKWRYLSDLSEPKPVEVASVGWLVRDTDEVKVLCQNIGDLGSPDNAQASGIMTIPTRCVLSIEKLTEEAGPATVFAGTTDFAGHRAGSAGLAAAADCDRTDSEPTPQALESLQA